MTRGIVTVLHDLLGQPGVQLMCMGTKGERVMRYSESCLSGAL
jgi:hypothetical protein